MKFKKWLSALLSLAMLLSTLSMTAFAEEGATYEDGTYTDTATVAPDEDATVTDSEGSAAPKGVVSTETDDADISDSGANTSEGGNADRGNSNTGGSRANTSEGGNADRGNSNTGGSRGDASEGGNADRGNSNTGDSRGDASEGGNADRGNSNTGGSREDDSQNDDSNTGDSGTNGSKDEAAVSLSAATAAYNPKGTTFTVDVDPQSSVDYSDIDISYSAGRFSGTLEKDTDYTAQWDEQSSEVTVTILSSGDYNKLGQALTVSYGGTELGTLTIQSSATVTLDNDRLTLTGGNGETVANYIEAITAVTVDGTEYPTVEKKGAHEVYQVSEFFNTDGSVNFTSGKLANGAEVTVAANGFGSVTGTVGGKSEGNGGQDEGTTYEDGIYVGTATVQSSGRFAAYEIQVVVTVSGGEVTDIVYNSEIAASNASFATKALQNSGASTGLTLAQQVNSGNEQVDVVSGATYSSEAVWEAVQDALDNGPTTDPRSFVLTPAIYDSENGTTFTIRVKDPQDNVDYENVVITYSMGKTNGTFEQGTDYTAQWDEQSGEVTVTILPSSGYNKLGQLMTVSCAGNAVGSLTIKSGSTVTIENNKLVVTGGDETLEDYFKELTAIVIDGESYSVAGTHGATPIPVTEFFDEDGSVNFNSDKFADGAEGTYKISIEANGFDMVAGTVGSQSGPSVSSDKITVPEGLADGNYAATVKVEPDDNDGFDFYNITVTVAVKNGGITGISVSGASSNNTQYSHRAETGIGEQITGKGAGQHDVDVVSMATCSSKAIIEAVNTALQGAPVGNTTLTLSEATYEPDGTPFTVTVKNPEEGVDYSDITLSYAAGKFSESLTEDGYTVELVSESGSELVYKVTVLNTEYIIDDDSNSKYELYNELGRQLDVTVAGTSAGRVVITSSATVELKNNQLTLTGGNGETLADYLEAIEAVTISYTDENGAAVENRYAAKVEHDQPVEYYPTDIFDEKTGKVNFDCSAFVYGEAVDYTVIIETMNDCFGDLTSSVGASAVKPEPSNPEQSTDPGQPVDPEQPSNPEQPGNTQQPWNTQQSGSVQQSSGTQQSGSTKKSSTTKKSSSTQKSSSKSSTTQSVKTGDEAHLVLWMSLMLLFAGALSILSIRRKKQ